MTNEHDFTGTRVDWEMRVFLNATSFRIHRFYGHGQHDSLECATFEDAIRAVGSARRDPNARVTVYAITASGRFTLLDENRWAEFLGANQARCA